MSDPQEQTGNWQKFCTWLGRSVAQAVSRRPLATEARIRSLVSPCEIDDEQNGIGIDFSPSSSVSSYQYYSTNGPHSSSSRCCSSEGQTGEVCESSKSRGFFFGNRVSLVRKVPSLLTFCYKIVAMVAFINRTVLFHVCGSRHFHFVTTPRFPCIVHHS